MGASLHARVAAAQEAPDRAVALHDEARTLYEQGDYRAAVSRLEEAVRLDPGAKVLFYNLGLIYEKLGELDKALVSFRRCRELETNTIEREKLDNDTRRIESAQGHADDARRKSELAKIAAKAPAAAPAKVEPAPLARPLLPWVWLTAGVSLVGLGVGSAFAVHAVTLEPGKGASTGPSLSYDELVGDASAAHSSALAADVGFTVGGVAGAAALGLALFELTRDGEVVLAPVVTPETLALEFVGRF